MLKLKNVYKNLLSIVIIFFLNITSGFAQNNHEYKVNIQIKDTIIKGISLKSIADIWTNTNWIAADEKGQVSFASQSKVPDCLLLRKNNDMLNTFVFLEPGQSVDLKVDKFCFSILGDDLVSRQNSLLQAVNVIQNEYTMYLQNKLRYKTAIEKGKKATPPTELNLDESYNKINEMIKKFEQENINCSPVFIRFINLENKYFKIKNSIAFPQKISKTYHPYTAEELNLMQDVIEDSRVSEAMLSFNYRFVLRAYMDYLRINDPKQFLGNGLDFLKNEIKLSDYLYHPLLKQYLITYNLYELFYFNRKNEEYLQLVKQNCGEWAQPIIDECKSFKPKVAPVNPASDFPRMKGVNAEGQPIALKNFLGKWVFIDFWATWCGPCRNQIPYFLELQKRCKDLPIVFLGVSVDKASDKELWLKTLADENLTGVQMLSDDKQTVYSQFEISGIPHFAIIDPQGKLHLNAVPFPSTGILERYLKDLVTQK